MFNNTKLFAYFYIQLVFVNFVYKKCYLQVKQEDIMDIGNKLKELRVLKGLTQEELADRSELSKGFISQLERNQNSPSIGTLLDIIQCLGTTPAEFFTDEEPEQIVFEKDDYFEKSKKKCNIASELFK